MRSDRRGALVAAGLVLIGILCLRPGYIVPDALATWSWLRSLVLDGDLLFFNEWGSRGLIREGFPLFKEVTSTGALANHWWIGSSWVGLVPYLCAHAVALVSDGALGSGGMAGIYAWTLAWLSVACLWVVWCTADRITSDSRSVMALALICVGSPVFWYTYRFPTLSHLPAAAVIAVLSWCVWRITRQSSSWLELGAGLAVGLAAAVRLQNALLILPLALVLVLLKKPPITWIRVAAGVTPFALLQGVAWFVVYGTVFGPLVSGVDPAGGTWAPFHSQAFVEVLFSSWNGLFFWAPVTVLSLVGWVSESRHTEGRERLLALFFLATFALQWVANAALDRWWWGGFAFGPRRWVDLALPLLLGLLWCIRRYSWSRVFAVAASAWGAVLIGCAASGVLDLTGPTTSSDILQAVTLTNWSGSVREIFVPSYPSCAAIAMCATGAAIVIACLWGVCWLARRVRVAVVATMSSALVMTLWIAATLPATRTRAAFFHEAFGIRPELRELGAVFDRRAHLRWELNWLERTGSGRAGTTREELRQLELEIARTLR